VEEKTEIIATNAEEKTEIIATNADEESKVLTSDKVIEAQTAVKLMVKKRLV
jgi:hypothetical protein